MREVEVVFGMTFPLEAVTDCRVYRAQASGVAAIALGSEPTTLTLTLDDGRVFRANTRGAGPEKDAIEAIVQRLSAQKTHEALEAIASGRPSLFGRVELLPDGIRCGRKMTRWEGIGGYAVRAGGLVWDDVSGKLAGEVRLADIPFPDALCRVIATRLPGRDYVGMAAGQGPSPGFFDVSARTRVPGTFAYGKHVLTGVGLLLLVAFVANFVLASQRAATGAAQGERARAAGLAELAAATRAIDDPAIRALPACHREHRDRTPLVSFDRSSISYNYGVWAKEELIGVLLANKFFVWKQEGATVRVILWQTETKRVLCHATGTIAPGSATAEQTAQKIVDGYADPPEPAASTPAAAPSEPPPSKPTTKPAKKKKRTTARGSR